MDDSNNIGVNWYDHETVLHPLGLAAVLILGIAMLLLPRRHAVLPMMIMACFISSAQRIMVFGCAFNLLRILVVFGWVRLLTREGLGSIRWVSLDTAMIVWCIFRTIINTILMGSTSATVYMLGQSFDALGMYFLFRVLVRNWDDAKNLIRSFTILCVPMTVAFGVEYVTHRNLFAFFGGLPEVTVERDGVLRCQGPFPHPLIAGCFFATMLPLVIAQWWQPRRGKLFACVGTACALLIVIATWSSTPLGGVVCTIIGFSFWPLRRRMRAVRWSLLLVLIGLHLAMKGPVWSLVARLDLTGSSTAYYRAALIDMAIRHFGDWWLVGIRSTTGWADWLYDITNQYVMEGIEGALTLALFIMIIGLAFRGAGRAWASATGCRENMILGWALGVSIFVHVLTFLGISYFGQIFVVWYMQLAMIGTLGSGPEEKMLPSSMKRSSRASRLSFWRTRAGEKARLPSSTGREQVM